MKEHRSAAGSQISGSHHTDLMETPDILSAAREEFSLNTAEGSNSPTEKETAI